jgi:serpin B
MRVRCPEVVTTGLSSWIALIAVSAAAGTANQVVGDGTTEFAFRLVRQLAKEQPSANIFVSPYSISAALQMVRNGASGETRKEMDATLGFPGIETAELAKAYRDTDRTIRNDANNAVLSIANSIWYAPNLQLHPEFLSLNKDFYHAKLNALDFTDPRASGMINKWVNEETRGRITRLFDGPLSGATGAVLANAIYFKGRWENQFEQSRTMERPFNLVYQHQKTVPTMEQSRRFRYLESAGFQAVWMPYAGLKLGMYLILPAKQSSPFNVLSNMNAGTWKTDVLARFDSQEGMLRLPKFKLEFGAELKPTLAAMGLRSAFGSGADFSGMASGPMRLDAVKHKAFVEVNEEGTEAAAATGAAVALVSAAPVKPKPFQMIVDRPFLFAIEDSTTGAILFIGIVVDP